MKKMLFFKSALLMLSMMLIANMGWSQASPADSTSGQIKGATVSIRYNSPSVKGRQIWGALVPYDKVWRAGANQATVFTTDQNIKVEGKEIPAGKYSLYAIPGEKEWVIILNSQTGQWGVKRGGETTMDTEKEVLRVTVKPKKSDTMNERLVYAVNKKGFTLSWENLEVPVSIK